MKQMYRKSLVAAAIAALVSAPALGQYTTPMEQLGEGHPAARGQNPSEQQWQQQQQQQQQPGAMRGESGTLQGSGELLSMTPHDLEGVQVIDSSGEEVGRIESIVLSRSDNQPHAVIAGGGFLGVGEKEIAVPLSQLSWSGDQLRIETTVADLGKQPQFQGEQFVQVQPEDRPISEFSAFELEQQDPSATHRGMGDPYSEQGGNWNLSPEGAPLDEADPRRSTD